MMEGRAVMSHSVSLCEQPVKYDQNQNDDSMEFKENSPHIANRLTKSSSWFNSLSRKACRRTPTKKRSFAMGTSNLAPGAVRPRLNKSDWDVRKTPEPSGLPTGEPELCEVSSRSTDCLDLECGEEERPRLRPSRDKMRKYHGVIQLLNSSNSNSDLSTLDLNTIETDARPDLDLTLNMSTTSGESSYYTIDSRRLASKHKKTQQDRILLHGVKQFNLHPERGLKYLEENTPGFLENTPESVAKFLFRQERLSKKQIGKYLGSHQEFNKKVLVQFVRCHEFTQLLLVQALRQFLWSFRLPGEAMQIDRVMDAFAEHYCQQNPNIFEERDTCFILSFSIIMLNTALHNPNAKMKITSEQFIKQNRGINSGKDLPSDMLDAIFRNIKEEPFKIPDETYDDLMYTFFSPEREGWLMKQGGSWKSWKRRWFVLSDRCLYYFQHTAETAPKGIIPLENIAVRPLDDKDGRQWAFEIYNESGDIVKGCKTDSSGTVVQGNHHHYRMSAASAEDRDLWMKCIRDSIENNPFSKVIAQKKTAMRQKSIQMQKFPEKNFQRAQDWMNLSH